LPGPYTVNKAKTAVLVANTVETVNFSKSTYEIDVKNHDATAYIYLSYGSAPANPTVEGDDTTVVGPGERVNRVLLHAPIRQVKLISSGTPKFTVEVTR
jgi:hypothetical protein